MGLSVYKTSFINLVRRVEKQANLCDIYEPLLS